MTFIFVVIAAALLAALEIGALIAAMFGLNRWAGDTLGPLEYGNIDLANMEQRAVKTLITHVTLIVAIPTAVWFLFLYIIYSNFFVAAANTWPIWLTMLLHAGAIFGGLKLVYKLDPRKAGILAGFSAIVYIFLVTLFLGATFFR